MKNKKWPWWSWVLISLVLLAVILPLGTYQNSSEEFTKFLNLKVNKNKNVKVHSEPNLKATEDYQTNVKREIAQARTTGPVRSGGPIPLRRKPMEMDEADYASASEYDIEVGDYLLKYNLYAVSKDSINSNDYKIVDEKLGFYIVESPNHSPKDSFQIVQVKGSKALGIFTGILKIKFTDLQMGQQLVSVYPAQINQEYAHLNRLLIRFDSFEATMGAYNELKSSEYVEEIDVEVLQYARTSK